MYFVFFFLLRAAVDVLIAHPQFTSQTVDMLDTIEKNTHERYCVLCNKFCFLSLCIILCSPIYK